MGAFVRWIKKAMMGKDYRCSEEERCLELVRLMLDEQATEEDTNFIAKHIDGCYRCFDNYDVENAIREAVKNKTERVKLSEKLVEEINTKVFL